jgi:hypothetical protein
MLHALKPNNSLKKPANFQTKLCNYAILWALLGILVFLRKLARLV